MRRTYASRPSQFKRLIRNEWVASESSFIDLAQWDRCTDPDLKPLLAKSGLPVWAALDLGLKHDATALMVCAWTEIACVSLRIRYSYPGPAKQ